MLITVSAVLVGGLAGFVLGFVQGQLTFQRRAYLELAKAEASIRKVGGFVAAVELAGWQAALRWYRSTFKVAP